MGPEHPSRNVSVHRLHSLSSDSVSLTPSVAGGGALGLAGCLAWAAVAGQQASPTGLPLIPPPLFSSS